MSNEKENERGDEAPSSDSDEDCWAERLKHKLDHPVVDVREYVISLGQAGIHEPEPIGTNKNSWIYSDHPVYVNPLE